MKCKYLRYCLISKVCQKNLIACADANNRAEFVLLNILNFTLYVFDESLGNDLGSMRL
jgi:hypothetical protein